MLFIYRQIGLKIEQVVSSLFFFLSFIFFFFFVAWKQKER